nr:MAG: DUF2282 domain-containing protein [Hyphomicrobiales bacterium]
MSKNSLFNARTLIAATTAAAIGGVVTAMAQTPATTPNFTAEKCYGIAKAGSNDCASTGNNSCGGTSRADGDRGAWIFVPTGVCAKIVNGSTNPA